MSPNTLSISIPLCFLNCLPFSDSRFALACALYAASLALIWILRFPCPFLHSFALKHPLQSSHSYILCSVSYPVLVFRFCVSLYGSFLPTGHSYLSVSFSYAK